ncbi:MAG: DUF6625 family protein [Bacteroidota bacterium]
MKKIAFIVPYFGKFPNYFPLWLLSCKYNPTIDWIVFTDDISPYEYPSNVKVTFCKFEDIVNRLQRPFDFPIKIDRAYQLCEFKMIYGVSFSDILVNYDFWGFCDIDVIWGDLRSHITDEILNLYKKISWRGHLTLFHNSPEINTLFKNEIEGVPFWKYAITNITGYPIAFDEREINYIFQEAGMPIYMELPFADLKIRSYNFEVLHMPISEDYKNRNQVFWWEEGQLWRVYLHDGKRYKENFAYVHFLKRPMKFDCKNINLNNFLIAPNKFIFCNEIPDQNEILKLSKKKIYWSYILDRLSLKYFMNKYYYYKSKKLYSKHLGFLPSKPTNYTFPAFLKSILID